MRSKSQSFVTNCSPGKIEDEEELFTYYIEFLAKAVQGETQQVLALHDILTNSTCSPLNTFVGANFSSSILLPILTPSAPRPRCVK